MNWSWFAPKSGYGSGIATWQGLVVTLACFGGIIAASLLLDAPQRDWTCVGVICAFLLVWYFTYDKDVVT